MTRDRRQVFLFDIDGVLVEPRGYRRATQAAVRHFLAGLAGEGFPLPGDEEYSWLEAQRITSEWDMVPLFLGAVVEHLLAQKLLPAPPPELPSLASIRSQSGGVPPDYRGLIRPLLPYLSSGEYPAVTAFRLVQAGGPLFPHLAGTALSRLLFEDTRSLERSAATRLFQNLSLGAEAFRRVYRREPEVNSPSYLQTEDLPLLNPAKRERLLRSWSADEIDLAAYTLRPSLPPREARDPDAGYSPEAEMALALVGLDQIPIIGYGRILFLGQRHGLGTGQLTKPAPVQALAAVHAALGRQELPALEAALRLWQKGAGTHEFTPFDPGRGLLVHVFEDSAGGIEAVRQAGLLLNQSGFPAEVRAWGISSHPEKVRALEAAGVTVFPHIDAALDLAL